MASSTAAAAPSTAAAAFSTEIAAPPTGVARAPAAESRQDDAAERTPGRIDFVQYWVSGRLLIEGRNPYDPSAVAARERELGVTREIILLRGPPWTLTPLLPFLLLPFEPAHHLWLIVNVLLVSVSLLALHRGLGSVDRSLVASAVATACFYPIFQSLIFGQVSVALLACVAGFVLAESRGRPFLAGFFLAPLTIKPHLFLVFGAIVLWTVLKEGRVRLLYGASAGFALLLLPIVLLDAASFGQWLESLSAAGSTPDVVPVEVWRTVTLAGVTRGLIFDVAGSAPTWPMWLLPPLGLLAASAWIRGPGAGLNLATRTPVLLCLSYLFAPYGWVFDQAILLPLQVAIVNQAFQRGPDAERAAILGLTLGIQALAILVGLDEDVSQHEFFWIPLAMLAVWYWTSHRVGVRPVLEGAGRS